MEFGDIELVCRDCGKQFLFTAGEQAYYQRMGLMNTPGRCPDCRARRKQRAMQEGRSSIVSSTGGQQQELDNHHIASPQPVSQPPSIVTPPVEQPASLEASATTKAQSVAGSAPASPNTLQTAAPVATPVSKLLLKRKWKAKSRVLVFFSVQIYAVKDEGESDNVAVAASESDNIAIAADKDVAANSSEVASENARVIEPALISVATTNQAAATTTATVVIAIVCSSCGRRTTVPFVPEPGRPVYCANCFFKQ